jgi:hypothetical protein
MAPHLEPKWKTEEHKMDSTTDNITKPTPPYPNSSDTNIKTVSSAETIQQDDACKKINKNPKDIQNTKVEEATETSDSDGESDSWDESVPSKNGNTAENTTEKDEVEDKAPTDKAIPGE